VQNCLYSISGVSMRTITISDNDEMLLKDAIRNQIDLIDNLPALNKGEIRNQYVDLVYRTSGYVV
jgi:hypothetical protein